MQTTEDTYRQVQALLASSASGSAAEGATASEPSEPVLASVTLLWRSLASGKLEIFLVRRALTMRFLPGFWAFPGGKQDAGDASAKATALRELHEETGVCAAESALCPLGRWITPEASPLRYDTQYFLVELPAGQEADVGCSEGELIDGLWLPPREAMRRFEEGRLLMSSPVVRMLEVLSPGPGDRCSLSEKHRIASDESVLSNVCSRALQAARDEALAPRLWGLAGGIAVSPLRTPTLPPATRTNCYVIGTGELIVIDPGSPDEDERQALCEALDSRIQGGAVLREIWLTHHHSDHMGAAKFLAERYQVPISAHPRTAELLEGQCPVNRILADGERRTLAGSTGRLARELECIFTPGHAPGHLCFYEHQTATLVAGDMVASEGSILIDPSEGDMGHYLESLARLRTLGARLLLPAHGFAVSEPDEILLRYIRHRLSREQQIVAALVSAPQSAASLVATVYAETPEALHPLAERSLLSHLVKLEREGLAGRVSFGDADGWVLL